MTDCLETDLSSFRRGKIPQGPQGCELPPAVRHLGDIVEAATAADRRGRVVRTTVRCRRRPERKRCCGLVNLVRTDIPRGIRWWCPECGDRGFIKNWRRTRWDMSDKAGIHWADEPCMVVLPLDSYFTVRQRLLTAPRVGQWLKAAERSEVGVELSGPLEDLAELGVLIADAARRETQPDKRRLLDDAFSAFRAIV